MENILVNTINAIKLRNGGSLVQGTAAIAAGSDKPSRGYITDRILAIGDKFTIPSMEGEQVEQWLFAPAVDGGRETLHCIVKLLRGSVTLSVPMFIGNFVKEVTATDGSISRNQILDKAGQPIDLVSTTASIGEQWHLLAGRTFVIEAVTPIKTMRRNRKTMVPYEGSANVYIIREV